MSFSSVYYYYSIGIIFLARLRLLWTLTGYYCSSSSYSSSYVAILVVLWFVSGKGVSPLFLIADLASLTELLRTVDLIRLLVITFGSIGYGSSGLFTAFNTFFFLQQVSLPRTPKTINAINTIKQIPPITPPVTGATILLFTRRQTVSVPDLVCFFPLEHDLTHTPSSTSND